METMLEVAKKGLVGSHDAVMMERFVLKLYSEWAYLHRSGRSKHLSAEARYRVHQVIGSVEALWSLMEILDIRRFKNRTKAVAELREYFALPGVRDSLCSSAATLLSIAASRRLALLNMANHERDAVLSRGHRNGAKRLEQSFVRLLGTGVLSEMPNTLRVYRIHEDSIQRFCRLQRQIWLDVQQASVSKTCPLDAKALLSRITGLSLFEGVRALKALSPTEKITLDELIAWHLKPQQRKQRGFFANVGLGVHELNAIAEELGRLAAAAPSRSRKQRAYQHAEAQVREMVFSVFMTGILSVVPS